MILSAQLLQIEHVTAVMEELLVVLVVVRAVTQRVKQADVFIPSRGSFQQAAGGGTVRRRAGFQRGRPSLRGHCLAFTRVGGRGEKVGEGHAEGGYRGVVHTIRAAAVLDAVMAAVSAAAAAAAQALVRHHGIFQHVQRGVVDTLVVDVLSGERPYSLRRFPDVHP